jgi:hypothetical protein
VAHEAPSIRVSEGCQRHGFFDALTFQGTAAGGEYSFEFPAAKSWLSAHLALRPQNADTAKVAKIVAISFFRHNVRFLRPRSSSVVLMADKVTALH